MSVETMLLAVTAATLLAAVLAMRELPLILAVVGYAGMIVWQVGHDMTLLLPSIGVGIGIGILALVVVVRREVRGWVSDEGGDRYIPSQQITNKSVHI
ncbi:hypothetical protein MTBLM5_90059 [Magnetospirillum sp. LM-5]|uniref:hypothetical protein n=1 Tax=Magnetospirillum sp. LM-5 TaxID=2681466 RepID=UPI00138508D1|nr:hypothetical protein [Magnetospirillum sp. LM-5]CAA7625870.1 hypothetical protein MTBLM5_90059 [Magnetospirillum sp. LM-5]